MASITFDFLSRGADQLAHDFTRTGDSAGLAARGVQVLQDVIERLGPKENRTAAESRLLASALRETGDAADRAAAKAVIADAAIRRLGEGMAKAARDAEQAKLQLRSSGTGGIIDQFFAGSGPGGGGGGGIVGALFGPAGLAIVPALGAALVEVTGLVSGFAAAGAGAVAFGALAANAYGKLTSDIAALHTANENFQQDALNVDTALKASALDTSVYNKALAAMPPNLRSAAILLGDQNARWQDLTTSQQNNVVALANNSAAIRTLLPSQKTALAALIAAKKAWDDMTPAQQAAATSMNKISDAWGKLTTAFAPNVFKIINDGLKVTNQLLPSLLPFATAFANALDGLLKRLALFTASKGFTDWLKQFQALVGPSVTAIGEGLGKVAISLGKLLTIMSQKDVVNSINIAFTILAGTIDELGRIIQRIMSNWDQMSSAAKTTGRVVGSAFLQMGIIVAAAAKAITGTFLDMVGNILNGAAKAFGWIPGLGGRLRQAAADFSTWRTGVNSDFDKVIAKMQAWQAQLNGTKTAAAIATASITSNFTGVGVAATTTGGKVNQLAQALTRLPKSTLVTLTETGTGNFTITQGTSGHAGGTPGGGRPGNAAGALITSGTGPTADDVLVRVSRGELIVPAHLVSGGWVNHLKGLIPGFAAGGSIGALPGQTTSFNDRFIAAVTAAMEKAMTAAMKLAVAAATAAVAGGGGPVSAGAAQAQAYARSRLGAYGWAANQMSSLISLWNGESGWNRFATNPLSGAYGIPQALPPSKMGPAANPPTSSAGAQIDWGMGYIRTQYGNPATAYSDWLGRSPHWYDRGGWLQPGLSLAYNGTGSPEMVVPGGEGLLAELRALRAEVRHLTGVAAAIPQRTGQHVGAAVGGAAASASFRLRYPS